MKLDLQKNNYIEEFECKNIEQDISRSWRFLKETHNLYNPDDCLCIRGIVQRKKYDKYAYNKEFVIYRFDDENYMEYSNFVKKIMNYERVYNLFYNVYEMSISTYKENIKERILEGKNSGFIGKNSNASGTSMLIADFDNCNLEDYYKIKQEFKNRNIETIDVMSGHGFHIIVLLSDKINDNELLLKWINILQETGLNPDTSCCDSGRVMRLPFFLNRKEKYGNKPIKSKIISGEYNCKKYSINQIFQKFDKDYNSYKIETIYKEKEKLIRDKKEDIIYTYNENVNLYKLYPNLDIDKLPTGIQNMLKGFRKGYSNTQTLCLTLFFKNICFSESDIIDILKKCESINSNRWNSWNVEEEVIRFYNNYNYINKYLKIDTEIEFGPIYFYNNTETYKIPINYLKPGELKFFIYNLINKDKKKKEILNDLEYSNNKLDRILKNHFIKNEKNYELDIDKEEFENYIYLNKKQIEKLLKLNENEIIIYLYLLYRIGFKREITTSIKSIENNTFLSNKTITNTIKQLEDKNIIIVKGHKYINKISNTYMLNKRVF